MRVVMYNGHKPKSKARVRGLLRTQTTCAAAPCLAGLQSLTVLSKEAVATLFSRASRDRTWPRCAPVTVSSGLPDAKHHWWREWSSPLELETTTPPPSSQA